jgi:MFS family permease
LSSPGIYAFCQRLAGPQAVGRWYGPQNGFANFAGIIGPALSGFLVEWTGNYLMPFAITSAICVLGVVAWLVVVGRVEPVSWHTKAKPGIVTARAEA